MRGLLKIVVVVLVAMLAVPLSVYGQGMSPQAGVATYTQEQIDQVTAPIALYPDPLVAQILMAATYPLEVVEAARWLQDPQNAQLRGDQLAAALAQQPWDPSIKALVSFPQVLTLLNNNLQWTEQLGDAFLAQQGDVMDSLQRLRQMAEAAGNLTSTPQQTVTMGDDAVTIMPTNPDLIYVPFYNPMQVYGAWPYPEYEPYYFPLSNGYAYAATGFIAFGAGLAVVDRLWGWDRWDWRRHRIDIDNRRFEGLNRGRPPVAATVWAHDPSHRHGVPYASPVTRTQFTRTTEQERRNFRGYMAPPAQREIHAPATPSNPLARQPYSAPRAPAVAAPVQAVQQPQQRQPAQHMQAAPQMEPRRVEVRQPMPQRQTVPAFESFSRGPDVRAQSERGAYSRSTVPAFTPEPRAAAPVRRSAPAAPSGDRHDDMMRH